jgi:hypothetical protein
MGMIEMILLAIAGAEKAIELVTKLIARAKQDAELTPAQEAEFDARLEALKASIHWKPEA